ncbi:hypothetical protein ACM01_15455 [Streptomyces viridochromogenes]|uniref:Uncharacterized protein n=1 Tax=Streptomyces viridochromogenes TaxID=1938 RepID=A0A0J7ZEM8_STRVR|nr:hypothetical protein [Streptomyces viridochromogenes]KMS74289.1 hypothetical protein ACM01_15455 [Streptomyces viridochromogenes]
MPESALPRSEDAARASGAAMGHALHALTALFGALGEGSHELNITADRTGGKEVTADLTVSAEPGSLRVTDSAEEYSQFFGLLTFALAHHTVHDAVLVATTVDAGLRACGWEVRAGWLHPIDPAELQKAVTSHPADDAAPYVVCHAPELHRPHRTAEERS